MAAFDIDGTFYRDSLFISLMDALRGRNILPEALFARSDELKKQWKMRRGSYNEYLDELVGIVDAGTFKGLREDDVRAVAQTVLEENGENVYVFTRELFYACRDTGYLTVAISHSPAVLVESFAKRWGFDVASGTDFRIEHGVYLGSRVKKNKAEVFKAIATGHSRNTRYSIAIGDSVSDIGLFDQVTHAIAFNPERALEKVARREMYTVVKERKDTIEAWRALSASAPFKEQPLWNVLTEPAVSALYRRLQHLGFTIC